MSLYVVVGEKTNGKDAVAVFKQIWKLDLIHYYLKGGVW